MGTSRARSQAEIKDRRQEIIDACNNIYSNYGFEAVNLKEIAQIISITRTAIYTYYKTKEEIFLDILNQEYQSLQRELESGFCRINTGNKEEYCGFLTDSLINHEKLLKLLAEHYDAIENNSRFERLCEYKKNIYPLFSTFVDVTRKVFPRCTVEAAEHFLLFFFSSIGRLYSLSNPTEKQKAALQHTPFYKELNFREVFYKHTLMIARDL